PIAAPISAPSSAPPARAPKPKKAAAAGTTAEPEVDESLIGVGSIAAGGRYDELVGMFSPSGTKIPCVGISFGVERIFSLLVAKAKKEGIEDGRGKATEVFVMSVGDGLLEERMRLCKELWAAGIKAEYAYKIKPKLPNQFATVDNDRIPFAVIIGTKELKEGRVNVKEQTGKAVDGAKDDGEPVKREELISWLKAKLGRNKLSRAPPETKRRPRKITSLSRSGERLADEDWALRLDSELLGEWWDSYPRVRGRGGERGLERARFNVPFARSGIQGPRKIESGAIEEAKLSAGVVKSVQHCATTGEISLPLLYSVTRSAPNHIGTIHPLVLRTRDFTVYDLTFSAAEEAEGVWDSLKGICSGVGSGGLPGLYAFFYGGEKDRKGKGRAGWNIYEPEREFKRMGVGSRSKAWRSSAINRDYEDCLEQFCPSYPPDIVIPSKISDTTLGYAVKYRSKGRIPGLVYLHWANLGSITRSSQPMVGLKNARSIQDEKLIECIFTSHSQHSNAPNRHTFTLAPAASSSTASLDSTGGQVVYGAQATNLIIDARPTTNAMANSVKGAGTENMDHYKSCKKAYLGIDNIHVMRSSLTGIYDALADSETTGYLDRTALRKTNWLKHMTNILDGILVITRTVHLSNSHVLVHCSDGWDRTSQLSSLAQLCLDPFYRTGEGFAVLIEKDWLSYGHRFADRTGHLCGDRTDFIAAPAENLSAQQAFLASVQKQFTGSSHSFKETCPVFMQFLDCVYQMQRQFPNRFEFNEPFLRELQRETYAGKTGTFLFNSEKERQNLEAKKRTASIWEEVFEGEGKEEGARLVLKPEFRNALYDPELDDPDSRALNADQGVLMVDPQNVKWWFELFGRGEEEMNGRPEPDALESPVADDITIVESASDDPIINPLTAETKNLSLSSSTTARATLSPTLPPSKSRSTSPQPPSSPQPSRSTNLLATSGASLPSQVQLAGAVSSVQKFGWGAWKAAQKGYQEAVTQYRESSTVTVAEVGTPPAVGERPGIHARVANGESSASSWKAMDGDGELRSTPWGSSSTPAFSSPSTAPTSPSKKGGAATTPPRLGMQRSSSAAGSPSNQPSTSSLQSTYSTTGWTDVQREPSKANPWERPSSPATSPVKPPPLPRASSQTKWPEEGMKAGKDAEDAGDPLGVGLL
ncbi:hypothetical protein P7C70_g3151, partial [Phenoliferia sp. Uapishka_3]